MRTFIILLLILFLAILLRFVLIEANPPAMYGDELTIVYDAYSLLKTGYDQTGKFLPLSFSMGEGRPAFYVYATIPFVAIFGPTPIAVRTLSLLSGLGLVILFYFLGKELFNKKVGFIAALFMAILPWDISLSRVGFETHLALFLTTFGILLFIKAKTKAILLIPAGFCFGLAIHTYHSYKIIVPLVLILTIWFKDFWQKNYLEKNKRFVIFGSAIFAIFLAVWLIMAITGSETRFISVNIFTNQGINKQIIDNISLQRGESSLSPFMKTIVYNKYAEYLHDIFNNYFSNLSVPFLFLDGDGNPRHNITSFGGLYLAQLILIGLAIIKVASGDKRKIIYLMLCAVIAPLPTTLVSEGHALRTSFLMISLTLLSAYGFFILLENSRNILWKIILWMICLIISVQFLLLVNNVFFVNFNKNEKLWSAPAKQATDIAFSQREIYDKIFLSDHIESIYYALPVYTKLDPNVVLDQNINKIKIGKYDFKKYFGNIYIGPVPNSEVNDFVLSQKGKILYIGASDAQDEIKGSIYLYGNDSLPSLIKYVKNE